MAPVLAVLPVPIVILFWLWALGSLVILIGRTARRIAARSKSDDADPQGTAVPPLPTIGTSPSTASTPTASTPTASTPEPPAPGPPAGSPTSGSRSGFFAAAPDAGAPTASTVGADRPTVAEAVRGIALPCGLSPVVDGTVSIPNPFRAAFITTEADAATVGAAMGDELERLGYSLATVAATELVARRPGAELRVVLYPTPGAARRGLDALFPAAPDGSVGLELSTGPAGTRLDRYRGLRSTAAAGAGRAR
jgi:hypothetical protein